jgi:GNAT superfamily N-acetyltransferase
VFDAALPVVYRLLSAESIDVVEPLWQKLRAYHAPMLQRFEDSGPPFFFQPRKQEILAKSAPGKLRIEVASVHDVDIAYAISTITPEGRGEVDSLFVEDHFRSSGIGTELMHRALAWFNALGASSVAVAVACENEGALSFYRQFGFHPRTIFLQLTRPQE